MATQPIFTDNRISQEEMAIWREAYLRYLIDQGIEFSEAVKIVKSTVYTPDLVPAQYVQRAAEKTLDPMMPANKAKPPSRRPRAAGALAIARKNGVQPGHLTPQELALMSASIDILSSRPQGDDIAFMHSIMCQVGLPRSKVDGDVFERRSGSAILRVQAGVLEDGSGKMVAQPLPYGPLPRLVLAWMNSFAVKEKSPEIDVGDSASWMLKQLGKGDTGKEIAMFRKQVASLAACTLTLGLSNGNVSTTHKRNIIETANAAWSQNLAAGKDFWVRSITFDERYFKAISKYAVPLDMRAYMSLAKSALAMDIYVWLAERLHRIDNQKPVELPWRTLRENQFGQEYQGTEADKNFKQVFLPALAKVLEVYPHANVKRVEGGLRLTASPPPVPYNGD